MVARKIFIVDDDDDVLASTEMLLRTEGHEVIGIRDWRDVPPRALGERPDLILQDIRMPGLHLERLVECLRGDARTADIPLVLFSAAEGVAETARRLGVHAYLCKPFNYTDLLALIEGVPPFQTVQGGPA